MRALLASALFLFLFANSNVLLAEEARIAVTVIIHGDPEVSDRLRAELSKDNGLPVDLLFASLPNTPSAPRDSGALDKRLGAARAAYIDARFHVCLERLGADTAIHDELGALRPQRAARLLFWRIACLVGAQETAVAERQARRFATLELAIPSDIAAVTPQVETTIGNGIEAVSALKRVPLTINGPSGGSVSVDGRRAVCAVPCTLSLVAGEHVVRVDTDGYQVAQRLVQAGADESEVMIETATASPELAASQWTERYASAPQLDSVESLRLLALAVRARRLVLLHAVSGERGVGLFGALTVDGTVAARSERSAQGDTLAESGTQVLRELLVAGQVLEPPPPLTEQPLFWIAVGTAAIVAGAIATAVLYEPTTRTEVGFR